MTNNFHVNTIFTSATLSHVPIFVFLGAIMHLCMFSELENKNWYFVSVFMSCNTASRNLAGALGVKLVSSLDPCKYLSSFFPGGENDRMYRTSCNAVPGRECPDCRSLTAICSCSTGSRTSRGICETLRGFTILASLLCASCAGRNQIL